MSIDEIFSSLASHMIQGIMLHEQLMNSYLFLGFEGYAKCHEYHYLSETKSYIRLCRYKIEHLWTLVSANGFTNPGLIPTEWFDGNRYSIDDVTKKQALASALNEWISWETETRELYEKAYKDLFNMNEIDAAEFIKSYILDVEEEIVYANNERLHKRSMDFDIVSILEEQAEYEKEFTKKIKKMW